MCVRHLHIYWDAVTIRHLCSLPLLVSFGGSCGLLHRLRDAVVTSLHGRLLLRMRQSAIDIRLR